MFIINAVCGIVNMAGLLGATVLAAFAPPGILLFFIGAVVLLLLIRYSRGEWIAKAGAIFILLMIVSGITLAGWGLIGAITTGDWMYTPPVFNFLDS